MQIILLSGGSGTRLWPLSNNARSKQFLKVLRDSSGKPQSMVQRTFEGIGNAGVESDIVIATCETQVASLTDHVTGDFDLVVEPERRDTAPAIFLSCAFLCLEKNVALDETVVVMPIDTFADQDYYCKLGAIVMAVQSGCSDITLLGVEPTYPSEKFGYIVPEDLTGGEGVSKVSRFVEKPEAKVAEALIGQHALWNCGVFGFKLGYVIEMIGKYLDADSYEGIRAEYEKLPKTSFDYEVVEKAESVSVVRYSGEWRDLGTWNTLTEQMEEYSAGRVVVSGCSNTHVVNELNIPMVVSGVNDAIVVATPDGILVSDKTDSAQIKPLVNKVAEARPMHESRRWGEYKVLDQGTHESGMRSLEKILRIKAGKQLSYQLHRHRSEYWTVIDGEGEVVIDGKVTGVSPGSFIGIAPGSMHAVRALSTLSIVEVQLGSDLVEEDIERAGFYWPEG